MKLIRAANARGQFTPIAKTKGAQAAMMTLRPGETSDERVANEHPHSEQWLYVLSGRGTATVSHGGRHRTCQLRAGTLLVIQRGEPHQIKNSGTATLRTLNLYVPPAYRADGTVLPAARRKRAAK